MTWWIGIAAAYFVGSIPFGLIIGLSRGVDIRAAGSGNIGATNVGRLLGRPLGITCFVLDALKGALPVIVVGWQAGTWGQPVAALAGSELWPWLAVAVAALLGHMHSPWLRFKGGKGVATGFGAMLAMWTPLTIPAALALAVWIVTVTAWRYVSLASMCAAIMLPVASVVRAMRSGEPAAHVPIIAITAALAILVVWKHRANIGRLRAGTESRIGAGKKTG